LYFISLFLYLLLLAYKPAKENNLEEDRTGLEMKSGWKILGGRGMIRKAFVSLVHLVLIFLFFPLTSWLCFLNFSWIYRLLLY